ncbi:MAG: ATP-binding protein [Pseudanabaenaceae cyanobacterium bins.39]|nr:ATP-binding protein [Pseudanabaenaceae cyanobacterium bins.39]
MFMLGLETAKILKHSKDIDKALNDICQQVLTLDKVVFSCFYKTSAIADQSITTTEKPQKFNRGYVKAFASRNPEFLIDAKTVNKLLNKSKAWQQIEPVVYETYLIMPLRLENIQQTSDCSWGWWVVQLNCEWTQCMVREYHQIAMQVEMKLQFDYSQHQLQQQVQEAEQAYNTLYHWTEQYRHLIEQVPSVSYVSPLAKDGKFDLAYISPQIQDLLGVSYNHQLLKNWQDYVYPADRPMVYQKLQQTLETGEDFNCEYRMLRHDGSIIWVSDTAQIGVATDQKTMVLRGSVHDISDRKKAEAQLIAAKITESTNQSKSKFLAFMSHEIRTPMNTVIGMTDILLNTPLSPQQQKYVNTIRQGGEILLSIVNNILDFSRIESGNLILEKKPFILKECMEQVLAVMRPRAAQKSLKLHYSQSLQVPHQIIGDYGRLRQILINLVSNAIKFTSHGEISIKINAQKINADGKYKLLFAVEDTGIGIAPEAISQIFQSFSQADSSINRQYGGTGLGLAICKQLCELMEGEIGVSSQLGKGTTFYFSIVTTESKTTDISQLVHYDQEQPSTPILATTLGEHYPLKILVVEDHPVNREILLLMLEKMGYHADSVNDGIYALEALQQTSYDLVFMDLQMPIMDGLLATDRIRHSSYLQPWIIGLSANAFEESREMALQVGMNDYLTKPLQMETLIESVRKLPQLAEGLKARKLINSIAPSANLLPVLDASIFNTLLDSIGFDHISSLISSFIELSAITIANMQEAIQTGDLQTLEAQNHSLKGGSGTFGATKLHNVCQELQRICFHCRKSQICSKEDMDTMYELVELIAMEFQLLTQVVRHSIYQSSSA